MRDKEEIKILKAGPRVLVKDGKPAAILVLPPKPTPVERKTAGELRQYIEKMSGAVLPITHDAAVVKGNRVFIGAVAGYRYGRPEPGMAGFTLRTEERDIRIHGDVDYGTLYGAYELLEKLGVRWFFHGPLGEFVPKTLDVCVPELDETQRPDFAMRQIRHQYHRGTKDIGLNVQPTIYHSQSHFLSTKDYFARHPEWFALINGRRSHYADAKPCTSNPEVVKQIAANMASLLDNNPNVDMISLSYTDGDYFCECPNCRALDEANVMDDQKYSRRTLIFYNQVAEELVKTHPNVKILAGAYCQYNRPPRDPNIKAHPALALIITHYTDYCNLHPINDPTCPVNAEFVEVLKAWQRLIPDIYLYEYYYSVNGWYAPCQIVPAIRSDIPFLRDLGIKGLHAQTRTTTCIWQNFQNYYIAAKLLWNADADVDALLDDLYTQMFASAREPMKKYYTKINEALANVEMSRHPGRLSNPFQVRLDSHNRAHACVCSLGEIGCHHIFTEIVLKEMRSLLEEAKCLAQGDEIVMQRLDKVEASQEYTERFTALLRRRDKILIMPASEQRRQAAIRLLKEAKEFDTEIKRSRDKWRGVAPEVHPRAFRKLHRVAEEP